MPALCIKPRCLMGPGPSNVHPRVLQAIGYPLVGHLDPQFIDLMDSIQKMLRYLYQTENKLTIPVSGTGSAGMEASICNFIESGDPVLVCVNGHFSERIYDMVNRYGADATRLERPWGEPFAEEEVRAALEKKSAKVVALVHGETSTGAIQPLEGFADVIHKQGGLFLADFVASLGGVPINIDELGVDIAYSGTQKCISVPPGLAPFSSSARAQKVLSERKSKVPNWYLDLSMVEKYWGSERTYHHTAPINMNYALYEGLTLIKEETLEKSWERHSGNAELLWEGLEDLGLELLMPREFRLPTLTTVKIPEGVDGNLIRKQLLDDYNIEIAGGLGQFKGKVWRIGLMGYSSQRENVLNLLNAFEKLLR